jgi:GTP-binding protein
LQALSQQLTLPPEAILPFSSTEKIGVEEMWIALLTTFGGVTRL